MTQRSTRRTFIRHAGYAGATLPFVMPALVRAQAANSKVNVAFVGTGGRAGSHVGTVQKLGDNCVAYAEVDKGRWGSIHARPAWAEAKGYTDWRKMFENHAKQIDAVFVAVPDHSHFPPSMTAASLGIHCYTEKPLTWSVREAQLLEEVYNKSPKLITQMGNQGHTGRGWRRVNDYVQAGVLGDILEFHTWTNRPVWSQGWGKPTGEDPVPDNLDWDAWLGAAPKRPFVASFKEGPFAGQGCYHGFHWRGVRDFGAGALGDMACHTTDGIHAIMKPDYPTSVEPIQIIGPIKDADSFPVGSIIKWVYPEKGDRPGFNAYWYDGYNAIDAMLAKARTAAEGAIMPDAPYYLRIDGRALPRTGNLMIGSKGMMLIEGDYWDSPRLIPEVFRRDVGQVPKILEAPGVGPQEEFLTAVRGDKPREYSQSNWAYSGPMTAKIQLGNIAVQVGEKLEITPEGKVKDNDWANELLWREPREGWGPLEMSVA